ncbi:MAG: GNAT family N-acetyltransferase [Ardenticatenaceae bacterium]|nr:GNAT family N-acetyltransferase [Ardenticatenaceae bacterium]MCB8991396.1 GNAT family N-acetyltransferase [Ardenticatenaceae bacterium]MCB9003826.1 GNAT family N-acetyltransferase [Ardenticatenaceae bacterium]
MIHNRPIQTEADYWRVYRFLIDHVRHVPLGFHWDMRRWEGMRFYEASPAGNVGWMNGRHLWEDDGQLVGMAHQEGGSVAYLEIHPDYRHLEPEMVVWAEANLLRPVPEGDGKQLHFFVYEYDTARQELLAARGYEKMSYGGVIRQMWFGEHELAQPHMADGYTMRTTNPEDLADCQRIADLLNAAFGRSFHTAEEYQWFTRKAPGFRQYLDLVAVTADGTFASYVGIPYDDVNQRGVFEPVCTHPGHRQRGLGKALMQEGLLRLQAIGAADVTVETGDMIPANALYGSLGFTQVEKGHYWRKLFENE